jgi:hypothetical protein
MNREARFVPPPALFPFLPRGWTGPGSGSGFGALHALRREGAGWGRPEPLAGVVNTPGDEFHPSPSRDGRTLCFVRRDPRGEGNRGRIRSVPLAEEGF